MSLRSFQHGLFVVIGLPLPVPPSCPVECPLGGLYLGIIAPVHPLLSIGGRLRDMVVGSLGDHFSQLLSQLIEFCIQVAVVHEVSSAAGALLEGHPSGTGLYSRRSGHSLVFYSLHIDFQNCCVFLLFVNNIYFFVLFNIKCICLHHNKIIFTV